MKRILISLTLASCIFLAGCGEGESVAVTDPNDIEIVNSSTIEVEDLSSFLICEKNTRMIYYHGGVGHYTFMCPYLQNGHFCKYENGKIVEIIED